MAINFDEQGLIPPSFSAAILSFSACPLEVALLTVWLLSTCLVITLLILTGKNYCSWASSLITEVPEFLLVVN